MPILLANLTKLIRGALIEEKGVLSGSVWRAGVVESDRRNRFGVALGGIGSRG